MYKSFFRQGTLLSLLFLLASAGTCSQEVRASASLGIFESHGDIGTVIHAGSVNYDHSTDAYTVSGSGENMWFASDDFQFVWKKASGDISLAAEIALVGHAGMPHRKAMLMIRQSLDPSSPYVDIAEHGVGKTSLQFRDMPGAITHTIASFTYVPHRIELRKRGDFYYFFISGKDGKLRAAGASTHLRLSEPFYVGLGVCAHDKDVVEKAVFSHVKLTMSPARAQSHGTLYSTLETIVVGSGDRQVEYVAPGRFAAPNWSRDGLFIVFNRDGGLFRIPVKCGAEDTGCAAETEPVQVVTDFANHINNNHGISPNGQLLAITDQAQGNHASSIYLLPIVGGFPRKVPTAGQFYWHGWSADGKTIAVTGEQNGKMKVYTIPVAGGEQTQLTESADQNDGPEYSPDGKYIYFSSDRTGSMQIWRMRIDGSEQEQLVSDSYNDWFPHVSPDGRWIVYLSYEKDVEGHPGASDVTLHLMSLRDKNVRPLATLLGGEGTIDAPSWSPDSSKIAFFSYAFIPIDSTKESR